MSNSTEDNAEFDQLVEAFLARIREGESPSVESIAREHPEHADQIRSIFPMLALVENSKPSPQNSARLTLDEGSVLFRFDDFRILREIGRGGMGIVYEAVQESLQRRVALKVMNAARYRDQSAIVRFQHEAKAAAKIHHTNIASIFGVGQANGRCYYAMQLIDGIGVDVLLRELQDDENQSQATLRSAIASERVDFGEATREAGPWDEVEEKELPVSLLDSTRGGQRFVVPDPELFPDEYFHFVAKLGMEVSDALAHAHRHRVLHRDVKPGNLLIDGRGTAWITDFGLAKSDASAGQTQTGDIVGTLRYIAPERLRGESLPQGDIYSLGLTIYELLSRRPAFNEVDQARLLSEIQHPPTRSLRVVDSRIPRDLEMIVLKAIAYNPFDRYLTADEMGEDLRLFLKGMPVHARPLGPVLRTVRWAQRNPGVASLSTAILMVLVVGLSAVTWQWREAVQARKNEAQARIHAEKWGADAHEERNRAEALREKESAAREDAEKREVEAKANMYLARMSAAQHAWKAGSIAEVRSILAEVEPKAKEPDFRGFEFYQLWGLVNSQVATLRGHDAQVNHFAFTPDGKRLLSVSDDGVLKCWDWISGICVSSRPTDVGHCVDVAPDGKSIAVGTWPNGLLLGALDSAEHLRRVTPDDVVSAVDYSADGNWLAYATDSGEVVLGDPHLDKRTALAVSGDERFQGLVNTLEFSPDSQLLAVGGGPRIGAGTVRIWNVSSRAEVAVVRCHMGSVTTLAFAGDGRTLATGSIDKSIILWDVQTRKQRLAPLIGHTVTVTSVCFSPDGTQLLSGSQDQTVRLWNVRTGIETMRLRADADGVTHAAFSPDAKSILTVGGEGTIKIWNSSDRRELEVIEAPRNSPRAIAQGLALLTGASSELLTRLHLVPAIAFSPDGRCLAVSSKSLVGPGHVHLWEPKSKRLLGKLDLRTEWNYVVTAMAFSPDGHFVVTGGGTVTPFGKTLFGPAEIAVWETATWKLVRRIAAHDGMIPSFVFHPDGATLASAGTDGWIKLWDTKQFELRGSVQGHSSWVCALAYSPDGSTLVSGSDDNSVCFWDAETLTEKKRHTFSSDVVALDYSPAGEMLAIGTGSWVLRGANPTGKLILWDCQTERPARQFAAQSSQIRVVDFSPDGTRLLSTGFDGVVKLWDSRSAHEVFSFDEPCLVSLAASFSPDGQMIAAGGDSGTVRLWQAMPTKSLEIARHEMLARQAMDAGAWSVAKEHLDQLLEMGPLQGTRLLERARARYELGDWQGCLTDLRRARTLSQPRVVVTFLQSWFIDLEDRAALDERQHRIQQSRKLRNDMVNITAAAMDATDPIHAMALCRLGDMERRQNRLAVAAEQYRRALRLWVKSPVSSNCPDAAASMMQVASSYRQRSETGSARQLLQEVLELRRQRQGEADPGIVQVLCELANLALLEENFDLARSNLAQAMDIQSNLQGTECQDATESMQQLAIELADRGNTASAHGVIEEVLRWRMQFRGEFHPSIAWTHWHQADIQRRMADFVGAIDSCKRAQQIRVKHPDSDGPDPTFQMAWIAQDLEKLGRHREEEGLLQHILDVRKELPVSHPGVILGKRDLARCLRLQGRLSEAQVLIEKIAGTLAMPLPWDYSREDVAGIQAEMDALSRAFKEAGSLDESQRVSGWIRLLPTPKASTPSPGSH